MLRSFAGGRAFGASYGDGLARVVALPGWARTHTDFDAVLEGHDAIALDLPGFGSTPPPPAAWGSAEYAALAADVVRELDAPAVVVGHSFGGRVGVRLAADYPELVHGLLLTGAPIMRVTNAVKPKPGYRVARFLHQRGALSDARMEAARQKYGASDYVNAAPAMRAVLVRLLGETYEAAVDRIGCPVELVWGDDDTAAPVAGAELLDARFAGRARLTLLPGAGHLTPLTAVDELRAAIERLLA